MARPPASDPLSTQNLRAIYVSIVVGIGVVVVATWVIRLVMVPDLPAARVTPLLLAAMLPKIAVLRWRGSVPGWLWAANFGIDMVASTIAIHFGGGADATAGPIFYVFLIVLAGLLLSERSAYVVAVLCAASYGTLLWLEYRGWLPHYFPHQRPPERQAMVALGVGLALITSAWVIAFIVRHIRAVYREAEELRGEAVSALSHDLKNPLFVIDGYATMLETANDDERIEYAQVIQRAATTAMDLVRNVLDAAAVDSGAFKPEFESVRMGEITAEVAHFYRFTADAKGVQVHVQPPAELPVIRADPRLLKRAIGNLVSNAIKYTPRGGSVELAAQLENGTVRVDVRDDGPGIPPAEQSRLFTKFGRTRSSERVEGTGLGLFIVRCVAEAHGGSVDVASAVGRGSTFSLRVPAQPV
jgi:signal transduction histidine kinase